MNWLVSLLNTIPAPARPVVEAIVDAQSRYSLLPISTNEALPPAPVVVGLSGGADSVCLLHALRLIAARWNLRLHAAHVDHGLRAESAADAAFAERLAGDLEVEFHMQRLDGAALRNDPRGLEAAARAQRYAYLAALASSLATCDGMPGGHAATVAVGHQMDDQAETVLMNLVRGSGLQGLGGMPWVRTLGANAAESHAMHDADGVRLVRPLLGVRRGQVLAYLKAFGLHHREDHTNTDTTHLRNRVRHETLPALAELNPQIVETLARMAQVLGPEAERAAKLDRHALESITVQESAPRRTVIDLEQYAALPLAAQRGCLRLLCVDMRLDLREVGSGKLEEMLWRVRSDVCAGGPYALAAGVMWTVLAPTEDRPALLSVHRRDALPWQLATPHLSSIMPHISLPYTLACPTEHAITPDWALHCRYLDADELPGGWQDRSHPWRAFLDAQRVTILVLSTPADGMQFSPLGMPGMHKNLGDFFTDRKTPPALRAQWPIVLHAGSGSLVWVCGHTIAHDVRVTAETQRVLCLEWVRAQHLPASQQGQGDAYAQTRVEREVQA